MDLNQLSSTQWLLVGFIVLVVSQGLVTGVSSSPTVHNTQQDNPPIQSRILKRMTNIQSHLTDLSQSMGDLDEEISNSLRNCLGIHSELCEALELDSRLKSRQQLADSWFPGKRASTNGPKQYSSKRMYNHLNRTRQLLKYLKGVFKGANNVIGSARKRSCNFNLGFHCHTEEVSDFADWWDYLESPESPGKRSVRSAADH